MLTRLRIIITAILIAMSLGVAAQPAAGAAVPLLTFPFPHHSDMKIVQGWCYDFQPTSNMKPCDHRGIDYIKMPSGALYPYTSWQPFDVLAAIDGEIAVTWTNSGTGLRIKSDPINGVTYYVGYNHLAYFEAGIQVGKRVTRGQKLGVAGDTGTGQPGLVHLHFEVKVGNSFVDPYGHYTTRGVYPDPNGTNGLLSNSNHLWTTNPPTYSVGGGASTPIPSGVAQVAGDWNGDGIDTIGGYDYTTAKFFLRNTNTARGASVVFTYGDGGKGWLPLAGDWDGDGIDSIGLYDPAASDFYLRNSNTAGVADVRVNYGDGGKGWLPLAGDWNGDGVDSIGLYDPATSDFYLRNSNTAGVADIHVNYGDGGKGWLPLTGDWNGDRVDSIGLYDPAASDFHLRNSNTAGVADVRVNYGDGGKGWLPLAGDWDATGDSTIALYDPAASAFYLRNSNTPGFADVTIRYDHSEDSWSPLSGDWNGDKAASVGLYDPGADVMDLRDSNTTGPADRTFSYGDSIGKGWRPLAGDWDGEGTDSIGLYDPVTSDFYLRNSNTAGVADVHVNYGDGGKGWLPLAGDWNGDGTDTIGLYDPATDHFYLRNTNTAGFADTTFEFDPTYTPRATSAPLSPAGTLFVGEGVSVEFPSNAVATATIVTHIPQQETLHDGAGARASVASFRLEGATLDGQPVRQFARSYTLRVDYDAGIVTAGVQPAKLAIAYWDEAKAAWITVPTTVDGVAHQLSAELDHFTEFWVFEPMRTQLYLPLIQK
ncbi:MAG: M23 family metallopeptidase [Chloroflexales bacterium]|nr:M23 family metallopeptidase [Chloroflexales bacterium]